MPASREGFNLFNKYGFQNFFRRGVLGDKFARRLVIKDTFTVVFRWICRIFGHPKWSWTDWENGERWKICHRCFKLYDKQPYSQQNEKP